MRNFKGLVSLAVLVLFLTGCSSVVTGESWANLSTDGKYIYAAYKEQVFKIDPNPSASVPSDRRPVLWLKKLTNNPHFYAAPTVSDDGTLYVGSYNRAQSALYALRAENGGVVENWRIPTYADKVVSPATLAGDMVYIGIGDKGVRGYNRKTGTEVKFDGTNYGVWAKPLVIGETLYVSSLDHYLYALNATTLEQKWKVDLGGAAADAPTYDGQGMLYIGTWNSELVAVDISSETGKVANRYKTKNWVWSSPVYEEGVLYLGDLSGTLYALDAKTLSEKWTIPPEAEVPGGIRGRVGIAKNITIVRTVNGQAQSEVVPTMIVYGTEGKKAYAVDADKKPLWTSALVMSDRILSDILIVGNSAVFTTMSEDQLVVALNLSSGQRDWQLRLADAQSVFQPTSQP